MIMISILRPSATMTRALHFFQPSPPYWTSDLVPRHITVRAMHRDECTSKAQSNEALCTLPLRFNLDPAPIPLPKPVTFHPALTCPESVPYQTGKISRLSTLPAPSTTSLAPTLA